MFQVTFHAIDTLIHTLLHVRLSLELITEEILQDQTKVRIFK